MNTRLFLSAAAICSCFVISGSARVQGQQRAAEVVRQQHEAWVLTSLERMETVKSGMTRADLLKVFRTEGGVYSLNFSGRYVFRDCQYFKVDVEFKSAGRNISDADIIKTISQPYIQRIIID